MLKITKDLEKSTRRRVSLYGRFTSEYIAEVEKALSKNGSKESKVTLDLCNVTFVDRLAMEFLSRLRSKRVMIENTPSYVMRWIEQEAQSSRSS
jgi:hypothetical protein